MKLDTGALAAKLVAGETRKMIAESVRQALNASFRPKLERMARKEAEKWLRRNRKEIAKAIADGIEWRFQQKRAKVIGAAISHVTITAQRGYR